MGKNYPLAGVKLVAEFVEIWRNAVKFVASG